MRVNIKIPLFVYGKHHFRRKKGFYKKKWDFVLKPHYLCMESIHLWEIKFYIFEKNGVFIENPTFCIGMYYLQDGNWILY